jgi:drug/metabolite transporter (DMT)-like permease
MYLVVLLYALFASVFTISKTGLQYTQPLFFVGSRMFLAGILMLAYMRIFRAKEFSVSPDQKKGLILLGIFNIYLTNAFEFWGLQYLTSFKTCFIYSLSPFLSAVLSYLFLEERMTPKKVLGLIVGSLGFLPILLTQSTEEDLAGSFWVLSWAEISVLSAVICSVYGWIILRDLVFVKKCPFIMANGISMTLGGAIALVHSFLVENWNPIPVTEMVPFLEAAGLLIIISSFICYNLYGYLLKSFTATFMSFAGFTTAIFSALFGWIFLSEQITYEFLISGAIVFIGLLLFYQEELKREGIRKDS